MKCTSLSPDDKKYVEGIFQVDPKVGELPCHKAGDDSGSEASSLPLDDDTARADDPKNLQKTKQYGRRRVRDIENQQESVKSSRSYLRMDSSPKSLFEAKRRKLDLEAEALSKRELPEYLILERKAEVRWEERTRKIKLMMQLMCHQRELHKSEAVRRINGSYIESKAKIRQAMLASCHRRLHELRRTHSKLVSSRAQREKEEELERLKIQSEAGSAQNIPTQSQDSAFYDKDTTTTTTENASANGYLHNALAPPAAGAAMVPASGEGGHEGVLGAADNRHPAQPYGSSAPIEQRRSPEIPAYSNQFSRPTAYSPVTCEAPYGQPAYYSEAPHEGRRHTAANDYDGYASSSTQHYRSEERPPAYYPAAIEEQAYMDRNGVPPVLPPVPANEHHRHYYAQEQYPEERISSSYRQPAADGRPYVNGHVWEAEQHRSRPTNYVSDRDQAPQPQYEQGYYEHQAQPPADGSYAESRPNGYVPNGYYSRPGTPEFSRSARQGYSRQHHNQGYDEPTASQAIGVPSSTYYQDGRYTDRYQYHQPPPTAHEAVAKNSIDSGYQQQQHHYGGHTDQDSVTEIRRSWNEGGAGSDYHRQPPLPSHTAAAVYHAPPPPEPDRLKTPQALPVLPSIHSMISRDYSSSAPRSNRDPDALPVVSLPPIMASQQQQGHQYHQLPHAYPSPHPPAPISRSSAPHHHPHQHQLAGGVDASPVAPLHRPQAVDIPKIPSISMLLAKDTQPPPSLLQQPSQTTTPHSQNYHHYNPNSHIPYSSSRY